MKRKLLFVAALVASALGFNANAQTEYKDGDDLTNLIENASFADGFNGWKNNSKGVTPGAVGNFSAFDLPNNVEVYSSTVDVYQIVENVPDGIYSLTLKGFERPSGNGSYTGNEEAKVFLYMNDFETPVQNIVTGALPKGEAKDGENCYLTTDKYTASKPAGYNMPDYEVAGHGYVPNGMIGAAIAFNAGRYTQTVYGLVQGGKMTIGVTSKGATAHWVLWADFKLTYQGKNAEALTSVLESTIEKYESYKKSNAEYINTKEQGVVDAAINAATEALSTYAENGDELFDALIVLNDAYNDTRAHVAAQIAFKTARQALEDALNDTENAREIDIDAGSILFDESEDIDNLTTAEIGALTAKISDATFNITAYASAITAIEKAKKIIVETNIFTEAAKVAYQTAIDDAEKAYNDGTMTATEADALEVNLNGGTAHQHIGDPMRPFYAGAWSATNGVSVYTNNWSAEINNDKFSVPFVEDWLSNTKLANTTISASIPNLAKGTYKVKAKVRVRNYENKADVAVNGISLQVSLGKVVEISGDVNDIVGGQNFYLTDVEATGYVVKDNGTLVVDFNVNGTNASWLLIKAANYEFVSADIPEDLGAADESDYEALNAIIAAKQIGFEKDEYAPYNNIEALKTLNVAKAINQDAANLKTVIQEITETLESAEWTVNTEELNAIYDGSFTECEEDTSSPLDYTPAGWTPAGVMRQMLKNGSITINEKGEELEYRGVEELEDGVGALFMNTGTITYGEQAGYEIPLKDAYYKLQFKAASWNGEDKATIKVSIANGENGVKDKSLGNANKYVGTNTTMNPVGLETFELIFRTGAAGNYVFSVNTSKNAVVSGFELKKITDVTVEVSEIGYATFSSEYPLDLSKIDGGTAYIVADESAADGSLKLTEQTEAVPANTGLLITVDGESAGTVTIPVATEGKAPSKNYLKAGKGEAAPVGSYVLSCKYAGGGEEYDLSTVGFYAVADDKLVVEKGKAYLDFAGEPSGAKVLHFVFGDDNATTVEAIEVAETEADGALYNVAGQQVGKDYKGIVIKNGKKYLNK